MGDDGGGPSPSSSSGPVVVLVVSNTFAGKSPIRLPVRRFINTA